MFTIIGGDGKEYGPVTDTQVRSWITAGRANLQTRAKAMGSDEWRALGDFPEFSAPVAPPLVMDVSAGGAAPAHRGIRLLARILDWVIEFLCSVPGLLVLGPEFIQLATAAMRGQQPDFEQMDMARLGLGGVLLAGGWLLQLVVQVWLLSVRGQSLGKLAMGIRVVRVDGSKAGFVKAWLTREALVTFIGFFLGMMPILGPLMLRPAFHITDWCFIFRDDQRCLHDLIAGTRVVKADAPARST